MSQYRLIHDPQYPNAVTLITPGGQKVRMTEYPSGELRFRIAKATPMVVRELYLTGEAQDAIVTLSPGWSREEQEMFQGAVGETVMNARRLVAIGEDMIATLSGLSYQLGLLNDVLPTLDEEKKRTAFRLIREYVQSLSASKGEIEFVAGMEIDIKRNAYDLRRLGQMSRIKNSLSRFVESWTGKNHTEKPIQAIANDVEAKFVAVGVPGGGNIPDLWRGVLAAIPHRLAEAVACLGEATRHEVR
jgi:hypothetical protein